MLDFSFLAVPNIEGMRFLWYLKVIGLVLVFGVCLFFLLYFLVKYRRGKALFKTLAQHDRQAQRLEQQMLLEKVLKKSGKEKLVLYIEYLERFVTMASYAGLSDLLLTEGFVPGEVEDLLKVLHVGKELSQALEEKIHNKVLNFKF